MTPLSLALGVGGAALVGGGWLHYLAAIPKEQVPEEPTGHLASMYGGIALAGGGLFLAPSALGGALFAFSAGMGGFFSYLLSQAPTPDGELAVAVGDALPAIAAVDQRGRPFSSEVFAGRRVLFKFFRGHW